MNFRSLNWSSPFFFTILALRFFMNDFSREIKLVIIKIFSIKACQMLSKIIVKEKSTILWLRLCPTFSLSASFWHWTMKTASYLNKIRFRDEQRRQKRILTRTQPYCLAFVLMISRIFKNYLWKKRKCRFF